MAGVIKQCFTCGQIEKQVPSQLMAERPAERITASMLFQTRSLDVACPILTKFKSENLLRYFRCFVMKAVHIELVDVSTEEAFISAIKMFISRPIKL